MGIVNPYSTPGINPDGYTLNPQGTGYSDNTPVVIGVGHQGDQLVSQVHGQYGVMASRNGVFMAASTTAALAIPVLTTTSSSTFALNNPAGSGKNVELIRFTLNLLDTNAAPSTANVIGFSFVNSSTNATSAITKIADPVTAGGHSALLGGPSPVASVCSAITFASALTIAANWGIPMFSFPASWVPTVGGSPIPYFYEFNGSVLVPPGWAVTLVASTAWAANTVVPSLTWAEYYP
jgi:hypothetical protein